MIEDDLEVAEVLSLYLKQFNIEVVNFEEPFLALSSLKLQKFDLLILDLTLPGMDGLDVCKRVVDEFNIPIIISSARSDISDKVTALKLGADDYLPKPFNPKELLARIKAVLRRQNRELPGAPSHQLEVVEFGPWTLDLSTRTLKRDGNVVTLTTGEFSVLKALVQHPREPLTRDKLMNLARGREWGAMERSIDVQVSRLRRLIEDNPSQARYIQTVWGVGYVFVPDEAEVEAAKSE